MSEIDLHGTTDARVWAQEFVRIVGPRLGMSDEGLMIGWFANAICTGQDNLTAVQAIEHARSRAIFQRAIALDHPDQPGRDFSTAITKMEEAQMWFTRGLAKVQGKFNPADLEKSDG